MNWGSELGKDIIAFIKTEKDCGGSWKDIATQVNRKFGVNFHKDKVRKSWRIYVNGEPRRKSHSKASVSQYGNNAEVESSGKRIKTLGDMIKECGIDLNVWKIDRHVINKWEVGSKIDGQIMVEPLFHVKAWLSKIIPDEQKFPVVQPVHIKSVPIKRSKKINRQYKRALIIPDTQIGFSKDIHSGELDPFHDRKAMDVVMQIAAQEQPDRIILLGDMLDFPEFSDKFIKSPDFYFTTQPSLIEFAWWIACLIKVVPDVKIDYLEGNHEARLNKIIINHLIAVYDLRSADDLKAPPVLSIDNLLGLSMMGIKYHSSYPRGEVWINKNLRCRHGDIARKGGGNTSKAILKDTMVSEIVGHAHRFEMSAKTIMTNDGAKTCTVFSPGSLCRADGMVPSNSANHDWQQGVGMVCYDDEDFEIIPISINNGRAIYNGDLYVGEDYVERLKRDTGWAHF